MKALHFCDSIFLLLSVLAVGQNAYVHKLYNALTSHERSDTNEVVRIVGGNPAYQGQFPYQVSMQVDSRHICGGSIYDQDTVITAAHCCKAVLERESSISIVAGELELNDKSQFEQVIQPIKMEIHPNYTGENNNFQNDICLLHLGSPLNLNSMVQTIDLDNIESPMEDGTLCIISGWGSKQESGRGTNLLQFAEIQLLDNEACIVPYNEMTRQELFHSKNMICAGIEKGGIDSCQGDSGGPMACDGKLVGVVSFGMGCGRQGYPGIYAKVATFVDWIKSSTQKNLQTTSSTKAISSKTTTAVSPKNLKNGTFKPPTSIQSSTLFMLFATSFIAKVIL